MKRHFIQQYLLILVLSGIFGLNAVTWGNSQAAVLDQSEGMEQVLESCDDLAENTPELDGSEGPDVDSCALFPDVLSAFAAPFFSCHSTGLRFISRGTAIRQSQVNLLNSFGAPAFFILFSTYQGYLS